MDERQASQSKKKNSFAIKKKKKFMHVFWNKDPEKKIKTKNKNFLL